MKKVTLKSATVKASIAERAGIKKNHLEKLKAKWDNQKPLKVAQPKPRDTRAQRQEALAKSVEIVKRLAQ